MAYNKEELEKIALDAIEKHKLFFIEDIVAYMPCSRATFYNYELDKLDSIKSALLEVRTNLKVSMRSKWFRSENATLQLALMKLLANDEELRKLSMQHQVNEEAEKPIFNGIDLDVDDKS